MRLTLNALRQSSLSLLTDTFIAANNQELTQFYLYNTEVTLAPFGVM